MNIKFIFIVSIIFSFLYLVEGVMAAVNVSYCSVLNTAGETYYLNQSITNENIDCIQIRANNIVFDCQNNLIDGAIGTTKYGIQIEAGADNVTVKNCRLTEWGFAGLLIDDNSDGNTITNIDIRNCVQRGVWMQYSDNNNFTNIYLYHMYQNDGLIMTNSHNNDFTNITSNDHSDGHGFRIHDSNSNTFTDVTADDNNGFGIYFYGNSNTLTNAFVYSSKWDGIYIGGNSNNLTNVTSNSNSWAGIQLASSSTSNNLTNVTANNNGDYGIQLASSSNSNTIKDSKFQRNTDYGIYVGNGGTCASNNIYNNLFNNTNNIYFTGTISQNYFNTTNQTGDRIFSPGTEIGGNYWTTPTRTGYSDTCGDADKDGFCDSYYQLHATGPNIDYLPLTDPPPTYSSNSTNSTLVSTITEYRLLWEDNDGLSGYIFSFDNCTGSFANDTWVSMTGTSDWSSVTKTTNSTGGCTIKWKVYANDTSNDWNESQEFSYIAKSLDGSSCTANAQCLGGYCVHDFCRSTSTYCGDAYCDAGESCDICVPDCGVCPEGEAPTPPQVVEIQPPQEPTELPETVIELPDITPGASITMPETGLTLRLEPNFVITIYPLTNLTAVVHNISKIEEPSRYKILLCNQTLISSYEIELTVDLAYFCANYSGYDVEDPTVNIFKFEESDWRPLRTDDVAINALKKIICGKITMTPYMVTGFTPTIDSQTALFAIKTCSNSITLAIEQGTNVSGAEEFLEKAWFEYYSCNYAKAKEFADKGLETLVVVPPWLIPVSFAAIAVVAVGWFWYYTVRIKVRVKR